MKIVLFNNYTLEPFVMEKHYDDYVKLLENNHTCLHAVEMEHVEHYDNNRLAEWFRRVEHEKLPNYLIMDGTTLIGRLSLINTVYDEITFPALSIFVDKKYHNLGIMSCALKEFFNICEELQIKNILWEAKSINKESNHLAIKLGFHLWKQITIDPKAKYPDWSCPFYNLYLR